MPMNAKEGSCFNQEEDVVLNSKNLKQSKLIKADEKLYLIDFYINDVILIYESNVDDEYIWKKIGKSILWNLNWLSCFNKGNFYFFNPIAWGWDDDDDDYYYYYYRQYWKFNLGQLALIEKYYYYGDICLKQKDKKIECYFHTFKFDPDSASAYINSGKTIGELITILAKIENFTKKINLHPCYWYYLEIGNAWMDYNMYSEAIEWFNEAIKCRHDKQALKYYYSYYYKAKALRELGRNVEAIECYDEFLKINPKDKDALIEKGNILLYDLGRSLEAIWCYNKVTKHYLYNNYHYYDINAYYHKGNAYLYDGCYYDAIICYNHEIFNKIKCYCCENSMMHNVYNNKGYALNMLGKHLEAIECYNQSIKMKTKDAIAYNNKGDALSALGRNQEAIECYNKAIELEPSDFLLFCNRGRVFNCIECKIDALKDFKEAYNLMQKIFEESYKSDLSKKQICEWNNNFFNSDLSKNCVELLKKLVQMQEFAIEFEELFLSLKNVNFDDPWVKTDIVAQKKAIKTQMSWFIIRIIEFLGSNNHESYEELQQDLYKLEKKATKIEKLMITSISGLKSLLKDQ